MSDQSTLTSKQNINRTKVYLWAGGIFLLANFAFEVGITMLESSTQQNLFPIFPFTRIGLLLITILAANYYIRRRTNKPKIHIGLRIAKYAALTLVAYGLTMGAWLSVSSADTPSVVGESEEVQYEPREIVIPEPPVLTAPDSIND